MSGVTIAKHFFHKRIASIMYDITTFDNYCSFLKEKKKISDIQKYSMISDIIEATEAVTL